MLRRLISHQKLHMYLFEFSDYVRNQRSAQLETDDRDKEREWNSKSAMLQPNAQ